MKIYQTKIAITYRVPISSLLLKLLTSCAKDHTCLCTFVKTSKDTIIESVKTTKLGFKGFKETCRKKESDTCRI